MVRAREESLMGRLMSCRSPWKSTRLMDLFSVPSQFLRMKVTTPLLVRRFWTLKATGSRSSMRKWEMAPALVPVCPTSGLLEVGMEPQISSSSRSRRRW